MEETEAETINKIYNDFLAKHSDTEADFGMGGKSVPYIGWFWREINFHSKYIPIGNCGEFIGFMANNKWGHPERDLLIYEVDKVIELIDEAMHLEKDGSEEDVQEALKNLWEYMQTLTIEGDKEEGER